MSGFVFPRPLVVFGTSLKFGEEGVKSGFSVVLIRLDDISGLLRLRDGDADL